MADERVKVAILGGGVAGLCAAFALSEIDPDGDRFDITLYQLGWRLGGKCASGRNAEFGQRIEEHGLHIWAGFYENAFTIMRAALKALDRPPGTPQASIGDCFERQNEIFLTEKHDGQWLPWPLWFEPDPDPSVFPGRDDIFSEPGSIAPSLGEMLQRAIDTFEFNHSYYAGQWPNDPLQEFKHTLAGLPAAIHRHVAATPASAFEKSHPLLSAAGHLLKGIGEGLFGAAEAVAGEAHDAVSLLLRGYHGSVKDLLDQGGIATEFRRYLIMADFGIRIMDGLVRNGCLQKGLAAIDHLEFREFLNGNGPISPLTDSALVSSLYDYTFAYDRGAVPTLSACSAVSGIIRLFMTYKGAFFWKATAGMGDTICSPIYQLLLKRGAKVKFFHEVTGLDLTPDGAQVSLITLNQQAEMVDPSKGYDPLVVVNGLPSWPSEPDWAQLKDGAKYKADGVDFEDVLDPPPARVPNIAPLQLGKDFDKVIMAMSLDSLRDTCKPLIAKSGAWAAMMGNMRTTRTQALQLWLDTDLAGLGGPYVRPPQPPGNPPPPNPMGPIATNFQKPFDTWSDMSHLNSAESWPVPAPKTVAYFCSVMPDTAAPDEQHAANAAVLKGAEAWMNSQLHTLWTRAGTSTAFNWNVLHVLTPATGPARLQQQFWQANINPSERYVLSLPGTLRDRLSPGASGFENLYLAGDWTKTPDVNAGCVEVAAMSGLMAAAALSGEHIPIAAPNWLYNRGYSDRNGIGRPAFANYGGWGQLPPPPSTCEEAFCYNWGLPAERAKLQAFLDRSINATGARTRFKPLLDMAFLMMVKTGSMYPSTPPWSEEGRMDETDMGLWIPVSAHNGDDPIPSGVGWLPAYLLVDNPYAAASGREIWGFPKYVGQASIPADPKSAGPFSASAVVIRKFAPTSRAKAETLFDIKGKNIRFTGVDGDAFEVFRSLAGGADAGLLDTLAALHDQHGLFPKGEGMDVPVYFLKQFRAANSATESCYQTQLKGGLVLDKLTGAGLMTGDWTLTLLDTDSLPFVRDLGLGTPAADGTLKLTSKLAFWGAMDFTVAMGTALP